MPARRSPRTVADVGPGDHLCCIYASEDEQRAVLVPFLVSGLERGEKVLYIVDARTSEAVLADLRDVGVDGDAHLAAGSLALLTRDDTYVRDGVFDPSSMMATLREATDSAVAEGYPALRVTGEMTWSMRGLPGSDRLIEYEAGLNRLLPGSRCLAICQYDRRRFDPVILLDVLRAHPYVAIGPQVVDNPYYVAPDEFEGQDWAARDLDVWMRNLVMDVEDRDRVDDALRASEARFRLLFDSLTSGFALHEIILDADGVPVDYRFLEVNAAFEALLGRPAAQLVGRTVREVLPGVEQSWVERYGRVATTGEAAEFEDYARDLDRTYHVIAYSPEPGRFAVIVDDTTIQARAAEELRSTRDYLENLFGHANAPIVVWDTEKRITRFNHAFEELTGHTADEVIGRPLDLLFPADDRRAQTLDLVTRASAGERWQVVEIPILRADGEVRTVLWNSATVYADDGTAPVATIAQGQDITDRIKAEDEVRASEARFRTVVESANDAILIADAAGCYVDVNPAACAMLGYTRDEILGMRMADLIRSRAGDEPRIGEQRRRSQVISTFEMRRRDGSSVPVEVSATMLPDGRILGIHRDIGERLRAQAQLLQAQKMETVGRLAGGVAHDFNNLLAIVLGNAEIARADLAPGDPRDDALLELEDAARRGVSLTRQLLTFSGRQVAAPEVLDLNVVVAEMERMLRRLIGETITFTFAAGRPSGRVLADRAQVDQVLLNLAVNARDAMPTGGALTIETAIIECSANDTAGVGLAPGRYASVAVTDTGTGIDEDARAHIFEPFFTTKGPAGGTGLGLATAQGIASQFGGALLLTATKAGEGTTFTLYLPTVDKAVTSRTRAPHRSVAAGSETVLVVEDDPGVRRLVDRILRGAGYRTLTASDGAEALGILAEHPGPVHLVLSDLVMPSMGGAELAAEVARVRPGTTVVLMSGYAGDVAERGLVAPPGTRFIHKPFTASEITAKIREALDR